MSKSCPIENRQICLISAVMFSLFLVSITSAIWYALVKYDLMLDFRKCQVAAAAAEVVQGTSEPSLEPPSTPSSMMDTGMELNPMLEFDKIESWNRQQLEAYTNTMIHAINSNASNTWKAYFNDALTMVSDVWKIPDAIFSDEAIENLNLNGSFAKKNTTQEFYSKISEYESVPSSRLHFGAVTEELPENFDCREKWLHCSYMQQPTVNQGSCGSCWVVSTTSTLSDRICVASNMTVDVQLSAFDVLSCCNEYCSRNMYPGDLCSGGSAPWVLNHFSKVGIVTGGSYGSIDGCKPYGFDSSCGSPCTPGRYMQVHKSFQQKTPVCEKKCRNGYSKTYEEDLYKADKIYYVSTVVETRVPESVQEAMKQMQRELYERGPIVACFTVYEDFILYRSGIYRQLKGAVVYGHCVRVVGWGVENGVPYWTAANSWGRDWGENGFFRIVRGENHLEFEDFTLAATINITTTQ